jgi:flagellar protein FlgJ
MVAPLKPVKDGAADTAADTAKAHVRAQANDAAEKFEAHFIRKMMQEMRASSRALSGQEQEGKPAYGDDMQDLADGLVADALAHQHAFGIADLMLRHVLPPDLSPAAPASPSSGMNSAIAQDTKR